VQEAADVVLTADALHDLVGQLVEAGQVRGCLQRYRRRGRRGRCGVQSGDLGGPRGGLRVGGGQRDGGGGVPGGDGAAAHVEGAPAAGQVGEDHHRHGGLARGGDLRQIHGADRLTGLDRVALRESEGERLARQLDGVDAHVHEHLDAFGGLDGERVPRLGDHHHRARGGRDDGAVGGIDGEPVAHLLGGEHLVGHVRQGHQHAGEGRDDALGRLGLGHVRSP
jgi:hypothetical protein